MWEWPRPVLAAILIVAFLIAGWAFWELTSLIVHP